MIAVATIGEQFSQIASSGPMLLAIPIAVIAGIISFLSPCVLPLVPGYLGYVTGLAGKSLEDQKTLRVVIGVFLFMLGFSAVFVSIGLVFSLTGILLSAWADVINRIMGAIVIVAGIIFMGGLSLLQREWRIKSRPQAGLWGAPLLGGTFAFSWAPCMGPTLAAVLALTTSFGPTGSGALLRGTILTLSYCLGLGIPFLLVSLLLIRGGGRMRWVKDHHVAITRAGGAVLIGIGILLITGVWTQWVNGLQGLIGGFSTVV
ncbi:MULTISPECIES: cytochrome c biogenesis CcdA family protein [Brevibacterium]|uniref:Cytochrome C biogenesis protein ResC n=3 Tax=Brevibacterium TaxID=1696 RepID=A0A144MED6_BRELN|nr:MULTISPECIES: cytochrome c biogenesis protein CcdA [Brevibacterium]AMT94944.1 cytochrome C biogenesis protein ResC [Brevibacterium linens]UVI35714.1 cytochrome c biogenesis protein CcdA [Brevibacterium spongiae]